LFHFRFRSRKQYCFGLATVRSMVTDDDVKYIIDTYIDTIISTIDDGGGQRAQHF
jgi:hypothetical protein